MKKALGTPEEKKMMNTFLRKSCHPHSINAFPASPLTRGPSPSGRNRLLQDLDLLISTHGLPCGFPLKARVLNITGTEDSIVSPSANSLLLKDLQKHLHIQPICWTISNEGHSILKPEIIKRVRNWLEVSN